MCDAIIETVYYVCPVNDVGKHYNFCPFKIVLNFLKMISIFQAIHC
jgi:hypothetical protein